MGVIIGISGTSMIFTLPSLLNKKLQNDKIGNSLVLGQEITYSKIFKPRRCLFSLMTLFITYITTTFFDSIIAVMLQSFYDIKEEYIGHIFLIALLCFIFINPLIQFLLKRVHRKTIVLFGLVLNCIGCLLTGPSQLLNLPV